MAICDEIAQRTHDLEDGIRAGLVNLEQVRAVKIIRTVEQLYNLTEQLSKDRYGYRNRMIWALINYLVNDVIESTLENLQLFYERKKRFQLFDEEIVNHFIYQEIIFKCTGQDYKAKNKEMLRRLFKNYLKHPKLLPDYIIERLKRSAGQSFFNFEKENVISNGLFVRTIADHIAGMTDSYAQSQAKEMSGEDGN